MPFQTTVNLQQAPAIEGDFASEGPRHAALAGEAAYVSDGTAMIGRFAWLAANGTINSNGKGTLIGFIHREQQALLTTYLAESGMVIPAGLMVTVSDEGDFFAKLTGAASTYGAAILANTADGSIFIGTADSTHVATVFKARNVAAVGELVKISTWGD